LTAVPVLHHPGAADFFAAPAQPVAETRQIKIPFKVIILAGRQHQRRDGLAGQFHTKPSITVAISEGF
jgi:hypothetical protein